MYKRKLLYFGLTTAFILFLILIYAAISANVTRNNLKQSTIAQSLLIEHQRLSSISYRLFKQLTDEVIFDQGANQANVRKKEAQIEESLNTISKLALQQRSALGEDITQGSLKNIDDLEVLIETILEEFQVILANRNNIPLSGQERLKTLLESTIDNEFRETINTALSRQSRVVTSINTRIDTINTTMLWFTAGLGALSLLLIIYACYWLFIQLYQPLLIIKNATTAISSGDYHKPITETLDDEFQEIATSINQLAKRLEEYEDKQNSSKKRLKHEVEQRTSELTKTNLELTKIDARRRQFISDVSHELRTPLTIIRGEAQVTLRLESANEIDYKATLNSVLEQAVNLSRLVDDLLLLTRAEMNQIYLDVAETDINLMVEIELQKWQRLHPNRIISINAETTENECKATIDPSRIQQVLSILVDNAAKYSAPRSPIELSIIGNSSYIKIAVKDFGKGISAAEIESVFKRFVRFSKHAEGLGLGLPIAKAIVEAHRGKIDVDSIQNEGSTFTITLPK